MNAVPDHPVATSSEDPFAHDLAYDVDMRERIDVRAIWAAIYRSRFLILGIVAVSAILGVVGVLLTTPVYQAHASVEIDQQVTRVLGTEDQEPLQVGTEADRFLQTQLDVLRSRALAQRVSQNLGLAASDRFLAAMGARPLTGPTAPPRSEQVVDTLQDNLTVNLPANTRVVDVSFSSCDPALAARVANSYVSNFIASNIQRRYSTTAYSRAFLQNQLEQARNRLETSERALNSYARGAQLIDTATNSAATPGTVTSNNARSPTIANLVQINQAYATARADRAQAEERWNQAQSTRLMDLPEVLANPAITSLAQQRAQLTGALASLRERLTPQHPQIVQANAQISEINQQMNAIATSVRESIRNQYLVAARQERALRSQVEQLENSTYAEQDRGVRYNILRREVDTNRELYDSLLNRFKEVSAAAGVVPNNVTPVDTAEQPRRPVKPNIKLYTLAALLAGLILSTIAVFSREWFDDTIRAPEQFEDKLHLPLLGAVPLYRQGDPIKGLDEPRSEVREAYHAIRAAIELSSSNGIPPSLLVTSSRKGEGKSTTAYALARDLAAAGRRTVLIDADLRNPTLHRIVGREASPGLSNLLARQVEVAGALNDGEPGQPAMIFAGPIPPGAANLLAGSALAELLEQLRQRFDIIILDGPPVMALADAIQLSAQVDGVLFTVEAGGAHFGQAKNAIRRLHRANANLIGGMLTMYNAQKSGYGADYYGYRYSSDKAP